LHHLYHNHLNFYFQLPPPSFDAAIRFKLARRKRHKERKRLSGKGKKREAKVTASCKLHPVVLSLLLPLPETPRVLVHPCHTKKSRKKKKKKRKDGRKGVPCAHGLTPKSSLLRMRSISLAPIPDRARRKEKKGLPGKKRGKIGQI